MKTIVFLILFTGSISWAGFENGNGGDVIYCENGRPYKVKILDEAEAERFLGWRPLATKKATYVENFQEFLSISLKPTMPLLAQQFLEKFHEFEADKIIVNDIELADIQDSNHQLVPKGCRIRQAVRYQPEPPKSPLGYRQKYVINGDIWSELTERQKSILVLHEVVYTTYFENTKDRNSERARFFNATIFSGRFNTDFETDLKRYNLLKTIGESHVEKFGGDFGGKTQFYPSGRLQFGLDVSGNTACLESEGYVLLENASNCKRNIFYFDYKYFFEGKTLFTDGADASVWGYEFYFRPSLNRNGDELLCSKIKKKCLGKKDFEYISLEANPSGVGKKTFAVSIGLKQKRRFFLHYEHLISGEVSFDQVLRLIFKIVDSNSFSCDDIRGWNLRAGSAVFAKFENLKGSKALKKFICE